MRPFATPHRVSATAAAISIRLLDSVDDYLACVELQEETWGSSNRSVVPTPILKIANRTGGLAAGAFDGDRLIGFIFGMPGIVAGRIIHWSHMLAVRAEFRDMGIGRRLKEMQFEIVRARGVQSVYWTYDPLVARNAHFNLCRLGVVVTAYEEEMYSGAETERLDYGTDRFIVRRDLPAGRVESSHAVCTAIEIEDGQAPIVNPYGQSFRLEGLPPAIRVEIPADIDAERTVSLASALRWRDSTRDAFQRLLASHYEVKGFFRDGDADRYFYLMIR